MVDNRLVLGFAGPLRTVTLVAALMLIGLLAPPAMTLGRVASGADQMGDAVHCGNVDCPFVVSACNVSCPVFSPEAPTKPSVPSTLVGSPLRLSLSMGSADLTVPKPPPRL